MSDHDSLTHSRRDFLQLSWKMTAGLAVPATLVGCGGGDGGASGPQETFVEPPTLASVNGRLDVTLNLAYLTTTLDGKTATLRNMAGAIPAPTLRVNVGDTLRLLVTNNLPPNPPSTEPTRHLRYHNSTNLHTHGLHVDPGILAPGLYGDYVLDDPNLGVQPGQVRQYEYFIRHDHPPGTYWYHPHLHGSSAMQVGSGMAGALLIEGPIDQVPEIAAAYERVFVFQAPIFDATGTLHTFGQVADNPTSEPNFLINGVRRPRILMKSGEVQNWRFINAAIWKFLNLSLDGHVLNVYSHDGNPRRDLKPSGPFPPDTGTTLSEGIVLAPANRSNVLVKAGAPGTYYLRTMQFQMGRNVSILPDDILAEVVVLPDAFPMDLPRGPLPVTSFLDPITDAELAAKGGLKRSIVMRVVFNPPPSPGAPNPPITQPPASEVVHPGADIDDWIYQTGNTTIADKVYALGSAGTTASTAPGLPKEYIPFQSHRALTQTVALDSVEEWTIYNMNNIRHPFHIHVNPMYVVKVNGQPIEPYWADTVALPPGGSAAQPTSITFRMRFLHYKGPYVMHCHMLAHEDMGMMQGVTVT
jgi:FtsP/CotA-like multicopper oxidase with cupredoxin domain